MEPDDAALVLACRAGDPGAWELLIRRYQRLVYSVPLRAGLGEDGAAEVFQRVFAVLFEKLDTITQPERVRSWLITTARRESWAYGRHERRTVALPGAGHDDEAGDELPDTGPLPGEALERMERQQIVRQAVAALDERCRTLLQLLFFQPEPPSYAAIAAALGTSEGSIGPTRARCLEKLRSRVSQLGI
jgi:RNA polymerase sigma factor (sigma-70 family)